MQIRREKGLCYTCDDKWSFTHKCPNKHLMILQVEDEDCTTPEPEPHDSTETITPAEHHLSSNALKGASGVGTMRFTGQIKGLPVQILVDGGSSDNFIQPRVAQFLRLTIEPAPLFKVLVGNGQSMTAEGLVQQLFVYIQGHELIEPVYLLPISGADLILGSA